VRDRESANKREKTMERERGSYEKSERERK
jgi:hypothetical protein